MGADAAPTPRQWQGHSHRALRAGLAHIRKGSLYMGAHAAPMPPRKRRAFNPKLCPSGIKLAHIFCEKAEQNIFFSIAFFLRREAQFGMQHPMLPGVWGEQPHKLEFPHESIRASFSKRNRLCFIKQSPLDFMPVRASFGIKRPAFTWGCGGGVSSRRWRHFLQRWRRVVLDVGDVARESGRDWEE